MEKVATIIKGRKKGGNSFDETAAFAIYCEPRKDGRLNSIATVAKKLGANVKVVEQMAAKNHWAENRKKRGETAILETQKTLGEQMKEKNIEHMREFEYLMNCGKVILQGQMKKYVQMMNAKKGTKVKFSAFAASVAQSMIVDGIKGQRVTLGLPTDVTKSMALNLNLTEQLPKDEIDKMQQFLDANYNKKLQLNGGTNTSE